MLVSLNRPRACETTTAFFKNFHSVEANSKVAKCLHDSLAVCPGNTESSRLKAIDWHECKVNTTVSVLQRRELGGPWQICTWQACACVLLYANDSRY